LRDAIGGRHGNIFPQREPRHSQRRPQGAIILQHAQLPAVAIVQRDHRRGEPIRVLLHIVFPLFTEGSRIKTRLG